jgi:cellulose 1,4-beta-cellobiosidase
MDLGKPFARAAAAGVVLAAFIAGPAGAAVDTTPPTQVTGVRLCPPPAPPGSINATVGLCWNAATDDVGVSGYDMYRLTTDGFVKAVSISGTMGSESGLTFGKAYTYYVVARDAAGNIGRPSALITATAVTGPAPTATPTPTGDTSPPTKPAGLRDGCFADYPGTAFCWNPSTDNVGVTGYDVYRQTLTGYLKVGSVPASSFLLFAESGLVTGQSYIYVVVAKDAAGNLSQPSDPVSVLARQGLPSPSPSPLLSCKVEYVSTTWSTGFGSWIRITNTGTTVINGWTLAFAFPSTGQRITQSWSAVWTQSGSSVTAASLAWNSVLQPGGSTQVGFNASHTGSNPSPARFTLNGTVCS